MCRSVASRLKRRLVWARGIIASIQNTHGETDERQRSPAAAPPADLWWDDPGYMVIDSKDARPPSRRSGRRRSRSRRSPRSRVSSAATERLDDPLLGRHSRGALCRAVETALESEVLALAGTWIDVGAIDPHRRRSEEALPLGGFRRFHLTQLDPLVDLLALQQSTEVGEQSLVAGAARRSRATRSSPIWPFVGRIGQGGDGRFAPCR